MTTEKQLKTVTVTLKVTFDADTEEFEGTQEEFEDYCVDTFVADMSEWTLRDIDSLIAALDVTIAVLDTVDGNGAETVDTIVYRSLSLKTQEEG